MVKTLFHPRRCHPERSVAESKDLRFVQVRLGWETTKSIPNPPFSYNRNRPKPTSLAERPQPEQGVLPICRFPLRKCVPA
jgi:hypothetical protein